MVLVCHNQVPKGYPLLLSLIMPKENLEVTDL